MKSNLDTPSSKFNSGTWKFQQTPISSRVFTNRHRVIVTLTDWVELQPCQRGRYKAAAAAGQKSFQLAARHFNVWPWFWPVYPVLTRAFGLDECLRCIEERGLWVVGLIVFSEIFLGKNGPSKIEIKLNKEQSYKSAHLTPHFPPIFLENARPVFAECSYRNRLKSRRSFSDGLLHEYCARSRKMHRELLLSNSKTSETLAILAKDQTYRHVSGIYRNRTHRFSSSYIEFAGNPIDLPGFLLEKITRFVFWVKKKRA